MQRQTLIDDEVAPAAQSHLAELKQQTSVALDRNCGQELFRIADQAWGAYRATGSVRYADLAEYASMASEAVEPNCGPDH